MATSVVYSSIFAAVMASIPGLSTKLICFDTSIVDLTDQLADPVEVLFRVQLGGGTDINSALAYCEKQIESPSKTHLVLIPDLYEGGDAKSMLARAAAIKQSGVNLVVLLTLSDSGHQLMKRNMQKESQALDVRCSPVLRISFRRSWLPRSLEKT
jgi:hypothetical protein